MPGFIQRTLPALRRVFSEPPSNRADPGLAPRVPLITYSYFFRANLMWGRFFFCSFFFSGSLPTTPRDSRQSARTLINCFLLTDGYRWTNVGDPGAVKYCSVCQYGFLIVEARYISKRQSHRLMTIVNLWRDSHKLSSCLNSACVSRSPAARERFVTNREVPLRETETWRNRGNVIEDT